MTSKTRALSCKADVRPMLGDLVGLVLLLFLWSQLATLAFAQSDPPPASDATTVVKPVYGTGPELELDTGAFLSEISDLAFSPDGRMLAVAGDRLVRLFDVESGKLLKTLRGDRSRSGYGAPGAVAFSPDGAYLLVGVVDHHVRGSIRMYRTDRLDEIDRLLPGHATPCTFIRFSRDGRHMVSSDSNGEVCIWDWSRRAILKRIPHGNPDEPIIDSLAFPEGKPYAVAVKRNRPYIYRVPDGREMQESDPDIPPKLLGWMYDLLMSRIELPVAATTPPRRFDFDLDRSRWATVGYGTERGAFKYWAGIWDARTMNRSAPKTAPRVVYDKHRWEISAIKLSPRGDLIATGDKFGEVHIWDTSGRQRRVIRSQGQSIYEAAFNKSTDEILFGAGVDYKNWGFNSYGVISKTIDLRSRTIRDAAPSRDSIQEKTTVGESKITIEAPPAFKEGHSFLKHRAGRPVSSYKLKSGKRPSVYTLLDTPRLGVQEPVLVADTDGQLAMWDSSRDELQRFYRGHQSMVTAISPAANGKIFVTSSTDRTIRIWSLVNHKRTGIFDFKYQNSAVTDVKPGTSSERVGVKPGDRIVSVDGLSLQDMEELMLLGQFNYKPGQVVAVIMQRGSSKYTYRMTMGEGFDYVEPLLNIFVGDNDEWIIWTPKGYYDCSPGADRLIGWHVNQGPAKAARFYRAEQFRKRLYRPDIINAIIETGDVDEAIRIASRVRPREKQLDLTDPKGMAQNAPPTVRLGPKDRVDSSDPRVTVKATIEAHNQLGIESVTVLHNGTPAKVFRPGTLAERQKFEVSYRCRLFPGRNEFAFIASNSAATSAPEEATLVLHSAAEEQRSKVYVLAIGITEYRNGGNGFDNLKFADDDAKAFVAAAQKHRSGKLYSEVETRLLLDDQATRVNILNGMQWLVDNVQPGDVVMLFAACHGFVENDNFYLATHEVDKSSLRATAISWREITTTLQEELPACKRVVFLDACHSAGIAAADVRSPLHDLAAAEMGTIFFASCTFQQQSFESEEWRHGAFTKSILDILGDPKADFAPASGDGLISTLELESGVSDKVKVLTRDRQHPVVYTPALLKRFNVLELLK